MATVHLSVAARGTLATLSAQDIVGFKNFFQRIADFPGLGEPPEAWPSGIQNIQCSEYLRRPFRYRRLDNHDIRIMNVFDEQ